MTLVTLGTCLGIASADAQAAPVAMGYPVARPRPGTTAFVDVTVIPMDREQMLAHQTVIVQGDRIMALGAVKQVLVPTGATRIDGRGKYLIPGLADMHAHLPGIDRLVRFKVRIDGDERRQLRERLFTDADRLEAERMLLLYAATGVTTVRVMQGAADILALKARAATGELFSPRLYVSTPPTGQTIRPEDSLAKLPAIAKAMGYDLIKLYGLNGADLDSLAAAAHRVGIPIAGHAPGDGSDPRGLEHAIQSGYASIEHLNGFQGGSWSDTTAVRDTAALRATAVAMRQAGVWNCPTMMVAGVNIGYFTADTLDRWPEMQYVSAATLAEWKSEWKSKMVAYSPSATAQGRASRRQIIKALHDAGAGLLLGTDAGIAGLMPGFAVHRELEEFVKAGLTPYEALATGTRNVAAYFGMLDSTGTVAVGKRADLVLLTGNPLQNIRETTHRAGVMLGGRWFPQAELDQRLKTLEGALF